ncbi:MAG: hypothetical protein HYT35_00160 [Candidatus Staskawiczbacteria bacterium]|nr:hypothetical protein [Candidatus Staskawiczbacteria bacterium]
MFDFIKNLFQYKAKSLEDFTRVVNDQKCKIVSVKPQRKIKSSVGNSTVGIIVKYEYLLEYTAKTPGGRKVIYQEHLFERSGSGCGINPKDAKNLRNDEIKLFSLCERRREELRTQRSTRK